MSAAWTIPDEEPATCQGCGLRSYDHGSWFTDHGDDYCPDCWREETPC